MTYEIAASADLAQEVAQIRRDVAGILDYHAEVIGLSQNTIHPGSPISLVLGGIPIFPHGDHVQEPGIPQLAQLEEAPESASVAYLRRIISASWWATGDGEHTPSPELTRWADMVVREFTEAAA